MTDRPILFSAPMVRALLAGTKTQTRRTLKGGVGEPPAMDSVSPNNAIRHPAPYLDSYCGAPRTAMNPRGMSDRWCWWTRDDRPCPTFKVPHVPGDRLWVREAWRTLHTWDCLKPRHLADDASKITFEADPERRNPLWAFGKLRPSMFMPRWASRLTLLVTEVRIERLQDIDQADAIAEGLTADSGHYGRSTDAAIFYENPREAYMDLWNHINGPGAWGDNPWVVATSFTVERCNIDAMPALVTERAA